MARNFKFLCSILAIVLCFAAMTFAQETTGNVEGTIKDPKGAVVPGVNVTLTGVNVGYNRTVQSDSSGFYRFLQVPAGSYNLSTAEVSGFSSANINNVTVTIEKTTTADIALNLTGSVNTVEVSADPLGVNVDTTDSKVQTNITSALIEKLPAGNNFTSILKVSPGTRAEPLSGGFQVDGASGSENSFVVDGQALENFRTGVLNQNNNIPVSLVQEVQVKTSGFEAEHGGASGAVITVATKGGTDDWRGDFGTQFEISRFNPAPRFIQSVYQDDASAPQHVYSVRGLKDNYTNYFPTASFGGPIVKKRVWFYGNYSPQISPLTRTTTFYKNITESSFSNATTNQAPQGVAAGVNLVVNPAFPQATYSNKTVNQYAFGRIDANIFNNLRYSGTFLWNPVVTEGAIPYGTISVGGTPNNARDYNGKTYTDTDFQAIRGGRTNSNNFTSQLVYTPTNNMIATVRYGHAFLNEKNGNYSSIVGPWFRCQGLQAGYTGVEGCPRGYDSGSNASVNHDVSIKNEINADLSYLVGNLAGRHEFKGGYQYGKTKNDVDGSPVNNAFFGRTTFQYGRNFDWYFGDESFNGDCDLRTADNPNGDCLGVGQFYRFGTRGVASNRYQAVYVQDKWQPITRLTLNLGIRLENENLPAFNTGEGRGGIPLKFGWGKKIAPRLGFAYDLFGDGKTKIWGSYGQFYDRLKFELPRGSFGGDFYRVDYFPILASHPEYNYYTVATILGSWTDPIGGGDPSTAGGLSVQQSDFRIPSNITEAQAEALGLPFAGLDPNLKPFRQSEITFGFERELSSQYVFSVRYSRKNVDSATEDHGILGANFSENYIISNPGEGKAAELDKAAGYVKDIKPQRLYNGVEFVLNKRFSHNYFYNVNYTWSRLYGNYSGLASSDEGGRTSPGVTRYFDYIVNGFTFTGEPDNGLLATDRTHTLKAYGGYDFNWLGSKTNTTEISFFQQILQGTPQTTYMGIQNSDIVFSKRGDLGRTPTYWQTDLSLSHRYKFGKDSRYTVEFNINVLNLFNNNAVTLVNATEWRYAQNNIIGFSDIDPNYVDNPKDAFNAILNGQFQPSKVDETLTGDENPRSVLYGQPSQYQAARNVRFGMRFFF